MTEAITVLVDRCTMQIHLDAFFTQATLAKQKRLLGYVFQEPWRNEETISTLGTYLPQKRDEAWQVLMDAYFRNIKERTSTKYRNDLTAKQKRAAEVANRKLLNNIKRCRTRYKRWGKIIAHFEMLKAKRR